MAVVQINRDPFARASLMRRSVKCTECAWCGTTPQYRMFQYWWERDSVTSSDRFAPASRTFSFCSIGCWRSFNA